MVDHPWPAGKQQPCPSTPLSQPGSALLQSAPTPASLADASGNAPLARPSVPPESPTGVARHWRRSSGAANRPRHLPCPVFTLPPSPPLLRRALLDEKAARRRRALLPTHVLASWQRGPRRPPRRRSLCWRPTPPALPLLGRRPPPVPPPARVVAGHHFLPFDLARLSCLSHLPCPTRPALAHAATVSHPPSIPMRLLSMVRHAAAAAAWPRSCPATWPRSTPPPSLPPLTAGHALTFSVCPQPPSACHRSRAGCQRFADDYESLTRPTCPVCPLPLVPGAPRAARHICT